jgi:hypothetical protein
MHEAKLSLGKKLHANSRKTYIKLEAPFDLMSNSKRDISP